MIQRGIAFALYHQFIVLLLSIGIIFGGVFSWIKLKKEAYPDVGDIQVVVITQLPGRAATEVERQVTLPLERVLNGMPHLITQRSKTIFGLSVIQLTFDDQVGDYFARQRVQERLAMAELPEGINPTLGPLTSPVGEILRYVLEADDRFTPMSLRTLQDWTVIPKLLQVPGVVDVINFGGLVKQIHVITSPDRLARYNLTLQNVIDAVSANNINSGGNIIKRGSQGFVVRTLGAIESLNDIRNTVVASIKGVPIQIKNLASVEEFPSVPSGILSYFIREPNGKQIFVDSSVQGLVAMLRGENPSETVAALNAKIEEINQNNLPPGVQIRVTYDRSQLVNYTLRTVSHTLFAGISIVIIALFLFLRNLKSAVIVALTIPISLLFSFILMKTTRIPANLLSLGAIDFGILVDGSVVMAENLIKSYGSASLEQRRKGILWVTLHSANEVSREIFFSILIIICAYLPIFTFERVEARLFLPMGLTLAFGVLGALVFSLTVVPILMSRTLKNSFDSGTLQATHTPTSFPIYSIAEQTYSKMIQRIGKQPKRSAMIAWGVVAISLIFAFFKIGTEFLPELDEGAINMRVYFPVGISLQAANKYALKIRDSIAKTEEVNLILTQLGRNDDGTDPYGPNRLEVLISLQDYSQWKRPLTKIDLIDNMKKELMSSFPGVKFSLSQPILDNVTEASTGSVADLAVIVNGEELPVLRDLATQILKIISEVPGATDPSIEQDANQAQLVIRINRNELARYGFNSVDIQKMIDAAIAGSPVTQIYQGNGKFNVVVRYTPEYRERISSIQRLLVHSTNTGARIPLFKLADIQLVEGPTLIQRQSGNRQVSVRTNIQGRDQGGYVAEAQKKVQKLVKLPRGYSVSWGGQFENLQRASHRLVVVVPITLMLICLLLSLLYRKVRDTLVVLTCIPFSIVGGILALSLRGYHLNIATGVGFISLFGISTMSGVLFVSRVNIIKRLYPLLSIIECTEKASINQFRPRLMTIVLAMIGLFPATLAIGVGSDVQRSLSTVIVGGLFSELLLTLLCLPSIYILLNRNQKEGI